MPKLISTCREKVLEGSLYCFLYALSGVASPVAAQAFLQAGSTLDDPKCQSPSPKLTPQQRQYWFEDLQIIRDTEIQRASNAVLLEGGTEAAASRAARDVEDRFAIGDRACADIAAARPAVHPKIPSHRRTRKGRNG